MRLLCGVSYCGGSELQNEARACRRVPTESEGRRVGACAWANESFSAGEGRWTVVEIF